MFASLTLFAGLILSGCGGAGQNPTAPAATPVRVVTAVAGPAAPTIHTHGLLANRNEIRLAFKVGGIIRELAVDEGMQVSKGQKLASIEQAEIDAQFEQAYQAQEKADRDLSRGERLHADQVISLEQLQDLRTQAATAAAAFKAIAFNRSHSEIIAPRDGTILRRSAEEREMVPAGEPVLVLGAHDKGYVVNAGLADREIVQLKLGDAAEVRLDALPDAVLKGTITQIASAADPASGLFRIEVSIDPADLPLRSGLVARLAIVPASAHAGERIHVPIGAIVEGHGNSAGLFVLERSPSTDRNGSQRADDNADDKGITARNARENTRESTRNTFASSQASPQARAQGRGASGAGEVAYARRRDVQVAFIEGDYVALASGLSAGEQVITDGALYLADGEAVEVVDAAASHDAR